MRGGSAGAGALEGLLRGGARTAGTVPGLVGALAGAPDARRAGGAGIVSSVLGGRLDEAGRGGALSHAHGDSSVPAHPYPSGVSGAAPIALAASAMGPGDTLIVEEPEAHLHPQSQARLAGHLAGLVRRGMRVALSTHSGTFLDRLGELAGPGALSPQERRGAGHGKDGYLGSGEVAAYAFGGGARGGHTISAIRATAEWHTRGRACPRRTLKYGGPRRARR